MDLRIDFHVGNRGSTQATTTFTQEETLLRIWEARGRCCRLRTWDPCCWPCCWPCPTAPLAAGPCVRLLGEEGRGGRARRGRKAGELLAEGDEQGGETSREIAGEGNEQCRGGERAGEGRELTLEDCRRAAPAGRSFQARSRGRAAPAVRRSRRGRSSAGGEEQRRRVKLPFGARLRAGAGSASGNRPGAR